MEQVGALRNQMKASAMTTGSRVKEKESKSMYYRVQTMDDSPCISLAIKQSMVECLSKQRIKVEQKKRKDTAATWGRLFNCEESGLN